MVQIQDMVKVKGTALRDWSCSLLVLGAIPG